MKQWSKPITPDFDEIHDFEPPYITVDLTDNETAAELLGPDGSVIRRWIAREPIGYRSGRWDA